MMGEWLNRPLESPGTWNFWPVQTSRRWGRGVEKLKMMFFVRNESKVRPFNFSDKMDNACIAAKIGQAAF